MGRPRKQQNTETIYIATESFTVEMGGVPHHIYKDVTRVRAGHPIMAGREAFFKPIDVHYDVEQATDNPGEKRG